MTSPERAELIARRANSTLPQVWTLLDAVHDPEVPVLSLWDLGVLQDIQPLADGGVCVTLTPTYSGCPAIDVMQEDVVNALEAQGLTPVDVRWQLSPAWSTDWLTTQARTALREYGIAPPHTSAVASAAGTASSPSDTPPCPRCASTSVALVSEFSSTACKSLYKCSSCGEPFDYFKPL